MHEKTDTRARLGNQRALGRRNPSGAANFRPTTQYHLLCLVQTPLEFVFSGDRATKGSDYGLARNWRTEP